MKHRTWIVGLACSVVTLTTTVACSNDTYTVAEARDVAICEILKESDVDYRSNYPERKIAFRDAKFDKITEMPGFLSEKITEIANLIESAEHPEKHVSSSITGAADPMSLGNDFLAEYRSEGKLAVKAFELVAKTCKKLGVTGLSTPYINGLSSN
jgi:hypothetical protein